MKRLISITLFVIFITLVACSKEKSPANELPSIKGKVSGLVTDITGKPLANVKVILEHTVWHATYVHALTNAYGKYEIALPADPAGSWTAKAQIKASAYGQEYVFDLEVDNNASFSINDATVRNFKWKLNGNRASGGYYGAHIDLYQWATDAPMTGIKLVLTPVDSFLPDGSPAQTLERTVEDIAGTFMVKDIPIGRYKVKAIYPGKTLLLDNRHDNEEPALEKIIVFGKAGYLGETEYNIEFWISE